MESLTVSSAVAPEVEDLIGDALDEHNAASAGPQNAEPLWIVARDAAGTVVGGIKGRSGYGWLFVDWLWVARDSRSRGLGARLLDEAEARAAGRGCVGVYLGSFTFQAPDFYKRRGYEEFGRLDGCPPGAALVWLKKQLPR